MFLGADLFCMDFQKYDIYIQKCRECEYLLRKYVCGIGSNGTIRDRSGNMGKRICLTPLMPGKMTHAKLVISGFWYLVCVILPGVNGYKI